MRRILPILFSIAFLCIKGQDYMWLKGTNNGSVAGVYGTKGATATINNPGGRSGSAYWKDNQGNYWLFGGDGYDFFANQGLLNDLWKYDPIQNTWTWMTGSNVINQNGSYGAAGTFSNTFNPGCRFGAAAWTDNNGDLWLFGGFGTDTSNGQGTLNDLWKYSISQNEWAFMGGTKGLFQVGIYTSLGVPSTTIYPGARKEATTWKDASGNFYLFGGSGNTTSQNNAGLLHDLWKYNTNTSEWTWLHGSQFLDQLGFYGTIGAPSATNIPGSRQGAMGWIENNGNIWLFGGYGRDVSAPTPGYLSDLWRYEPTTNVWTWMKGVNSIGVAGNYGQLGVPNLSNLPGGRAYGLTWKDTQGKLWMFGGEAYGSSTNVGNINDLWQFNPSTLTWLWIRGSNTPGQNGSYGTQNIYSTTNTPGGRNSLCGWTDNKGNLSLFGGMGHPASGPSAKLNDLWKYRNCHIDSININVTSNFNQICAGEGATLTATGGTVYTWSHNSIVTGSTVYASPATTSVFAASADNQNGCTYSGTVNLIVDPCISVQEKAQSTISIFPNPSTGIATISTDKNGPTTLTVLGIDGKIIVDEQFENKISVQLPHGVYIIVTQHNNEIHHSKLIVE